MPDVGQGTLVIRDTRASATLAGYPELVLPPSAVGGKPGPFRVEHVRKGQQDARGDLIEAVLAYRSGMYAIYLAGEVRVQFADSAFEERRQRAQVQAIGPKRIELSALLRRWSRDRRRAYDQQIANALQCAFDGDTDHARQTIDAALADAVKEGLAAGRLQYLLAVAASSALLLTAVYVVAHWVPRAPGGAEPSLQFWLASGAGLVGAAFSIALAIRSRTVALDTDPASNAADGALRLAIGAMSGALLWLLVASGALPKLAVNDMTLAAEGLGWKGVMVLGFVAGFLERLIPDLLDKSRPQPVGAPADAGR